MKKFFRASLAAAALPLFAADNLFDEAELFRIPEVRSAAHYEKYRVEGLESILLESMPDADGGKCFVFAYFALPESPMPEKGYPAVVLQHGNTDTCFPMIAKRWRDRGYAVISYDHYGNLPETACSYMDRPVVGESLQAKRKFKLNSRDPRMREIWAKNIWSTATHAHTFLRGCKKLDADKIFLVGVSHGALNGLIVAALDHRFAGFACCYGCGYLDLGSEKTPYRTMDGFDPAFDPKNFLDKISSPVFWVVGTNDFAFEQICWQTSIDHTPSTDNQAAVIGLDHGARAANYDVVYRWIDARCGRDAALPQLGNNIRKHDRVACAVLCAGEGIKEAKLCFARDAVVTRETQWETVDADIAPDKLSAALPAGATAYFFSALDRVSGEKMPVSSPFTTIAR
ncbi:MAG: hypothetical protein MJ016_05795 [Victivallaceae bacterium]|nr:hypothetical protein [Victivallaceae bacterium]